jgi:hypothetical protein
MRPSSRDPRSSCKGCNFSTWRASARFLVDSCNAHCFLSSVNSVSALLNSSFNSRTRLSCAAKATRNPFGSFGNGVVTVDSAGVPGYEGAVEEVGVGRDDSGPLLGATGNVRDRRFGRR